MTAAQEAVTIRLLDKEYQVACTSDERESLLNTVRYVDKKMREIRDSRKLIGADRIAVMAAINIAHDLLQCQARSEGSDALRTGIRHLQHKVEAAVLESRQMEL